MLKKLYAILSACTVLGLATPAFAQYNNNNSYHYMGKAGNGDAVFFNTDNMSSTDVRSRTYYSTFNYRQVHSNGKHSTYYGLVNVQSCNNGYWFKLDAVSSFTSPTSRQNKVYPQGEGGKRLLNTVCDIHTGGGDI